MLSHLPPSDREFLLFVYNHFWSKSSGPAAWRKVVVIPVLKIIKDRSFTSSYRIIGLTRCMCKTMNFMMNYHPICILERINLSDPQRKFCQHRSTLDCLVNLENEIQYLFFLCQCLLSVFDLENVYVWHYLAVRHPKTLNHWNVKGWLPLFIRDFLQECFLVHLGSILFPLHPQESGVPQGSVVSVTQFTFVISGIVNAVSPSLTTSLCQWCFFTVHRALTPSDTGNSLQKSSVSLGSEEWFFLLYRWDTVWTFHTLAEFTFLCHSVCE
jgi:hypothetical protein